MSQAPWPDQEATRQSANTHTTPSPSGCDDHDEVGLFELDSPTSLRCTTCGAIDQVNHESTPSLLGYGFDTTLACTGCGSAEITTAVSTHPHHAQPPASATPSSAPNPRSRDVTGDPSTIHRQDP